MADGHTHFAVAVTTATVATIAGSVAVVAIHPSTAGLIAGAWLGCISTPDNDHHWTTVSEQWFYRRSRLTGVLWELFWTPYQWMHSHRGSSHTWPYGTLVRFLYLLWLPVVLSLIVVPSLYTILFWMLVFLGESVQDILHLWYDGY